MRLAYTAASAATERRSAASSAGLVGLIAVSMGFASELKRCLY
jgi:hypothetical protein